MIIINTNRDPVDVRLVGAFATVGLTVRRMTSPDFATAGDAALATINDAERLEAIMAANGLMPAGGIEAWRAMKIADPVTYGAVVTGVGAWLGGIECVVRAVIAWTGINLADGSVAPVSREAIESLMLNEDFAQQVQTVIDRAATLTVPVPAGAAE